MITAGAVGGGYAALVMVALQLMLKTAFLGVMESLAWIFGSAILLSLIHI